MLLAQADRAGEHLAAGLRSAGHDVVAVEAYATHPVAPSTAHLDVLERADAVVLASGSAVEAWSRSAGEAPRRRFSNVIAAIVTIGRRTAEIAEAHGLEVAAVASAPDDDAIVAAVGGGAGRTMTSMAQFPVSRLRRLRSTPALRDLVAETTVRTADLIAPLFVREGIDEPIPISSLPGVVQHTRESLRKEVAELAALGVKGVVLFGVPAARIRSGRAPSTPTASPNWRLPICAATWATRSC